jgi:metal-responsive CopG/Arc/MetJ family transcriptional regulator
MRPASFRLCEDQLEKLDILVALTRGRKDRSVLIREALDSYIELKIPRQQLDFIAQ